MLSVHFGRFRVYALLQEVELGRKRELREEIPTTLYFLKQGAGGYRISCTRSASFGSESVEFNPFFDGEIDTIFIGNNKKQFEINISDAVYSYCQHVVKKLLSLEYSHLDVVYSCYYDSDALVQACEQCLETAIKKSKHV